MEYFLAALSIVTGIVAFFYDRSGASSGKISRLGLALIALIVLGGVGSGWLAYSQNADAQEAAQREEQLVDQQRLAQSMLMMQFVDLDRPFAHVNLNMNIEYLHDDNGEAVHPFSPETLGTFPTEIVNDGEDIAVFSFEPDGLDRQAYRFIRRGDQVGISRMLQWETPEYQFSSERPFNEALADVDVGVAGAFTWGFEFLPTSFGSFAQGPSLDTSPLAGEYLSKLAKQRYLGYLQFPRQDGNTRLSSLISDHTNTHIRLVQPHTTALSERCTRSVYIYLDLIEIDVELVRLAEPQSGILRETYQCKPGDLCFLVVSQRPIDVQPCELSAI